MKKILYLILCLLCCNVVVAQIYTLEQLKDSALVNNMAIRSARYDIEATEQQRKETFTKYFPTITGNGYWFTTDNGLTKLNVDPTSVISGDVAAALAQVFPPDVLAALTSPFDVTMLEKGTIGSLVAVEPIYAGRQIANGNKLAKVGEDVSYLKMQLSENEVEKTVEQYFWQLASLQEKMKTVEAVEKLLNDIHKDVEVAVRAGVAMRNDMLQVELRQNDLESQKLKLQNGMLLIRMLMAQYCHLDGTSFDIQYETDATLPLISRFDHSQAVAGTVEYQLLDKQDQAALLKKKLTVGKYLPTIAVGAGYNYHNLMGSDHTFGMIFATVKVPITDWWGGSHAIKRSKIEMKKAQDQLEENTELLEIRMQNAWNGVEESYQQLQLAQRGIEQAEENLRMNRDYYRAGTSKMTDLLEAQMLYQQQCDKLTDAFATYQNKLLEYRQSVGEK